MWSHGIWYMVWLVAGILIDKIKSMGCICRRYKWENTKAYKFQPYCLLINLLAVSFAWYKYKEYSTIHNKGFCNKLLNRTELNWLTVCLSFASCDTSTSMDYLRLCMFGDYQHQSTLHYTLIGGQIIGQNRIIKTWKIKSGHSKTIFTKLAVAQFQCAHQFACI